MQEVDPKCIFSRIGGEPKMHKAIEEFYKKIMADDSVNHFFKNTDMKKQHERQEQFLTMAFGGPNKYEGQDMATAHKGMNINEQQYNTVIGHLAAALKEQGADEATIGEVAQIGEAVKGEIVGK